MATDERVTEHSVHSEGLGGDAADKKKASKFQPFKKFFGRRKKREAAPDREDAKLKPSSSFGNVCNGVLSSDEETNDGLRSSSYCMGTRAFSHDSIFIPDGRAESEESDQAMSQENILGKVKTLQQQLAKNIKFGQPPQMTVSVKAIGEANASFEADVLLSSPMETETQQDTVLPETCNKASDTPDSLSPVSLPGTKHEAEQKVTPVKSSRPKRHHSPSGTIETVNLDAIPLAIARLDNSAAKHKLSVKPKNQRVSKKHRRLSKELQIVSEFEQEIPELQRYELSHHDGHHTADKSSQPRRPRTEGGQEQGGQEQKTEGKRKQEGDWPNLETEKKIQAADADVKNHLEHKRLQEFGEGQGEQEGKKQKLQVEERFLKMEERKGQDEKKRREDQSNQEHQELRHKGMGEQRRKEEGLPEWEVQKQQAEEEKHQELEQGKQSEEHGHRELEIQKQQEEQRQQKLKEQKPQEEQRHHELEAQRHQEEQRDQEPEVQWQQVDHRQAREEQRQQEPVDQKRKEEKGYRELERKQQHGKLLQQKGDKRQEQEKKHLQKTKFGHQEGQRGQELEEETRETGKEDELNQQTSHHQKRQKQERQKERNLEGGEMLQEKKSAMKLEKHKRPEERNQHLEEVPKSKDEQKQEDPQKTVRSSEHGECEPAELKQPWVEKRTQLEELIEKEGGQKREEQKTPGLEVQQPLRQPKEQDKSFQLPLVKNICSEEKCLERVEKELPLKEEPTTQMIKQPDKGQKEDEPLRHPQRKGTEVQEQERILGEELRWQEVDARQTMPRGFTFQVSSGEKQIIFPKVNLSPVTPVQEAPASSAAKVAKSPKPSKGSHALPSALCVPHTAILVTGAQLCGTAVNLNQIKDTACKSFLGLTEERKMMDAPPTESTQKMPPDAKSSSGKMKQPQDSLGNQAILAEWATIRSKILKSAENGKLNEKDKGNLSRHSNDWAPKGRGASHSQLRKTLSANAKFSITPAWQKFSEISKANNVDVESKAVPEAENAAKQMGPQPDANQEAVHPEAPTCTANVLGIPTGKTEAPHKVADNTEGCKFAKDLPSFLVPAAPQSLSKETSQPESSVAMESQQNVGVRKSDRMSPSGEENVSPFGVKLRRTNYSVRFHYDQQAEQKKKKRYSAGDSFDGVPTPLVSPNSEKDASNTFLKESKFPSQERKDSSATVNQIQVSLPTSSQVSAPCKEKPVCKSPLPQKPALAPKPISQTPPTSPLSKMRRSHLMESMGQKGAKMEPDTSWRKTEPKESSLHSHTQDASKNEEEESREKKSFFPSITMPWREKVEKKPEPLKKERPVLQSRHSIDGSKLMDKVETAQPLWITLALQKQKGFREQQATREERRQAREAKQAEKLAKENASINSQSDSKSSHPSRTSAVLKPAVQEEEKKVETATSRLERREQLKKSNTLPTSVTVEISDSIPTSPLAKEVTKRFSTSESNPVSTEPAWLALAKRKAKAWSDCPQIINDGEHHAERKIAAIEH